VSLSILHVTIGLTRGGAERAMVALAQEQKRRGHDVAVWAIRRGGPFSDDLREAGIPFWYPGRASARVALYSLRPRRLVVHSALFWADLSAIGFARARRATAVSTLQNEWDGYLLTPWQRAVAPRMYRSFDAVTAVSSAAALSFIEHAPGLRPEIVTNPTTPPPSDAAEQAARLKEESGGRKIVLCLGRLHPTKGFHRAVRALRLLPDEYELWIVGEGEEREALESLAAGDKRVRFFGPRDDVFAFYFAADCLVMPSDVEGMPLVALEAMHAGAPIVASSAGGLKELLELSPLPASDDLEDTELAARIERACTDPRLRHDFRAWAHDHVDDHSLETIADRYEAVYERALRA
jgi:glycosyltransferase involved in cell wall biosynthesis